MAQSSRNYTSKDLKILFGLSAMRCANPDCRCVCYVDENDKDKGVVIGKVAHIVASSDNGPRSDPNFPKEYRDKYENLILLCGNCHDIIDGQDSTYDISTLQKWKADHIKWIHDRLSEGATEITFSELDVISKYLTNDDLQPNSEFIIITPQEKIQKNNLTEKTTSLLRHGLISYKKVDDYISNISKIDPNFPRALKAGFVSKYNELLKDGYIGDDLFFELHNFSCGNSNNFRIMAAGLTVLTYLFMICEIFEI